MAILDVAAIDAEAYPLLSSLPAMISVLDRLVADLLALGALIDADRARIGGAKDGSREILDRKREQLHRNEKAHEELTQAVQRYQAEALKMLAELQPTSVELGEHRQALVGRISPSLLAQYEAAVREGRRPAIAAGCSACGAPLEAGARWLVHEGGQIVTCPGCMRLFHDPGRVQRDFMPPTARPMPKADA